MRIKKLELNCFSGSVLFRWNAYTYSLISISKSSRNLLLIIRIPFFAGCEKDYINNAPTEILVSDAPCIALTFDDGPDPVYTGMILNILKEKNVKATFFLVGNRMKRFPNVTRRIFDEGHTIANHSTDHIHLGKKSFKDAYVDIMKTEKIIDSMCGKTMKIFRPPFGSFTKAQKDSLTRRGFKVIMWDIDSKDFAPKTHTVEMTIDIVISKAQNNSVVLFHSADYADKRSKMNTVHALPRIIDILRNKGFVFKKAEEITSYNPLSQKEESTLWE